MPSPRILPFTPTISKEERGPSCGSPRITQIYLCFYLWLGIRPDPNSPGFLESFVLPPGAIPSVQAYLAGINYNFISVIQRGWSGLRRGRDAEDRPRNG